MPSLSAVILKVASRCNINCSYCYMYNLIDKSYHHQPKVMSHSTVGHVFRWVREYTAYKKLDHFHLIIHGGEPLLSGKDLIRYIGRLAKQEFQKTNVSISLSLLTNGLLLDEGWLEVFRENDIKFAISLDGPAIYHDRFRRTHQDEGTHAIVEKTIKDLITSGENTFTRSTLCVLSPQMEGAELIDYFYRLGLRKIDFILPDQNHSNGSDSYPPPSDKLLYARVLKQAYDRWRLIDDPEFRVRKFELLIKAAFGMPVLLDSIGNGPVSVFTVETNGEIECVDSMKICGNGYTKSGLFIDQASPYDVEDSGLIKVGLNKDMQVPAECRSCRNFEMCGAGYLPHRFNNGYFTKTVYCNDMMSICDHITADLEKNCVEAVQRIKYYSSKKKVSVLD